MTAITEAIDNLTQTIYLHNCAYPGVNPHSIPEQHRIYTRNKAIRAVLAQYIEYGAPRQFEETITDLANAINGDTK